MKLYKNETGFTLIEIMIVILIIGVLAAIGIPNLLSARQAAWSQTCAANCSTIEAAAVLRETQEGVFPTTIAELYAASTGGFPAVLDKDILCPADKSKAKDTVYKFDGTSLREVVCTNIGTGAKEHPLAK